MAKAKKKSEKLEKVNSSDERYYYGVTVNDVLYYFEDYDPDALRGVLLMKSVVEGGKTE